MEDGKILVTGGAGYIGSHAVRQLVRAGFQVVVVDNLSTGHVDAVDPKAEFVYGDVRNLGLLDAIFTKNKIIGVMQFAGKIIVPESVSHPLAYFDDNFSAVLCVLRAMRLHNCKNIVFSSTAAVYGSSKEPAITEDAPLNPQSPYGFSKLAAEHLICDCEKAYGIKHCIFRYFNVAGASEDGTIGEAHPVESHLIPVTVNAAESGKKMTIFGNDYATRDGTNLRDYIHVLDLADAHVLGMKHLLDGGESTVINLGSETGYTNKEIIETVSKVTGKKVNWEFGPRRAGDPDAIVASNKKAMAVLGWKPTRDLTQMIEDDVNWRVKHPDLYGANNNKFNSTEKQHLVRVNETRNTSALYEDIEINDRIRAHKIKTANDL
ncbi:MAG: UDP-glucose 4-epimerase GalE [Bacilli bacterium]|jgi:UDP-glucose 4-epimerase